MGDRTRQQPQERRREILEAAMVLASKSDYTKVTREQVAVCSGVSEALVSHYMGTSDEMRHRIVHRAIEKRHVAIVAQALLHKHPLVQGVFIDRKLQEQALAMVDSLLRGAPPYTRGGAKSC